MLNFDYISHSYIKDIQEFELCNTPDEQSVEMFLKEKALKLHDLQTAVTRLYFSDEKLVGFFTLHNDSISLSVAAIERLESEYKWTFPKDEDIYNFPSIKLHYLGVDSKHRNQGYGKYLINEVLHIASEIASMTGCLFITVEALKSSIDFYRKLGFKWISETPEFAIMVFKISELDIIADEKIVYDEQTLRKMVEKIVRVRIEKGYTHSDLAYKCNLDESTIEELEFSSSLPDINTIRLIVAALEIPLDILFK
ncbi:GNAT family N-acetyltransferase [Paenibacillus sp. SN-8-1]|uniref:GNAT family N-acetyltransferase n=1 Tax=Paenibacillus sp. SN-8-1 TaxID=3435409 RepID=UPI003D9A5214